MTREELLNKEVIRIKDLMEAYNMPYQSCAKIMRAIKDYNDRLQIKGCCHVLDYQEYWNAKSKIKNGG